MTSILLGAVLIEAIAETLSKINAKELEWEYILALVLGVVVAVLYQLDLFAAAGLETGVPYAGAALSGVVLGRGANYVHDLISLVTQFRSN